MGWIIGHATTLKTIAPFVSPFSVATRSVAVARRLIAARRVRPTLLSPLWSVAGFALGAATALMGDKAAMACTVAVEETIDEHYASQAEQLGDDEGELRTTVEKFRADELEHRDEARARGELVNERDDQLGNNLTEAEGLVNQDDVYAAFVAVLLFTGADGRAWFAAHAVAVFFLSAAFFQAARRGGSPVLLGALIGAGTGAFMGAVAGGPRNGGSASQHAREIEFLDLLQFGFGGP